MNCKQSIYDIPRTKIRIVKYVFNDILPVLIWTDELIKNYRVSYTSRVMSE
jgi:hypothetical protein